MFGRLSQIAAVCGKRNVGGWRDGCATVAVHESVEADYRALRKGIALADGSYLGHFRLKGPDAFRLIDRISVADPRRLTAGQLLPSYVLHEDGRPFFEMLAAGDNEAYRLISEGVDPARVGAFLARMTAEQGFEVEIVDETRAQSFLGLHGPYAWELLKELTGPGIVGLRSLERLAGNQLDGILFAVYRVDQTGEYGYWLEVDQEYLVALWRQLLELGRRFDIRPVGYEALDLCKLESRLTNIHREGRLARHLLELNARALIRRDRNPYRGRIAVEKACAEGLKRRLVGLIVEEDREARPLLGAGAGVYADGVRVGDVAHLAFSFALERWLALAFLEADYAYAGLRYRLGGRRGDYRAKTVSAPFTISESLRIRPRQDSYFDRKKRARAQEGEALFGLTTTGAQRFSAIATDRRAYRRTLA